MSKRYTSTVSNIDLAELKGQKAHLVRLLAHGGKPTENEADALQGILNLLDHVQDNAIEGKG